MGWDAGGSVVLWITYLGFSKLFSLESGSEVSWYSGIERLGGKGISNTEFKGCFS